MRPRTLVIPLLPLLLLGATPAIAQQLPPGTITTHATARDRLPNTVADVTLGIEAHARTLSEVQATLANNSTQLLTYLRTAGAERTRTQGVNIRPDLDPTPVRGQPPRIVGYSGDMRVAFQIEAGTLGDVLGDALGHGANTVQDTTLHPRQSELDGKRHDLAATATKQAIEEARIVAEAAGRHLGAFRVLNVDTPSPMAPRSGLMVMASSPSAMAKPIATEAGDTEITSTVTVTIALIEP